LQTRKERYQPTRKKPNGSDKPRKKKESRPEKRKTENQRENRLNDNGKGKGGRRKTPAIQRREIVRRRKGVTKRKSTSVKLKRDIRHSFRQRVKAGTTNLRRKPRKKNQKRKREKRRRDMEVLKRIRMKRGKGVHRGEPKLKGRTTRPVRGKTGMKPRKGKWGKNLFQPCPDTHPKKIPQGERGGVLRQGLMRETEKRGQSG